MADKRNNDWTDALRERLSSSELAPASDIWSKVERAAAEVPDSRRTIPKPFWWAAGCIAAAALAAIMILPHGGRNSSVQVNPHPQTVMAQSLTSQDAPTPSFLQTPSAPAAGPASVPHQYRPSSAPPAESFDGTSYPEETETSFTASSESQENGNRPSLSLSRRPVEEMLFENIPDESPKRRRSLTASLFASGIPGGSGTDGKYQISTSSLVNDVYYGFGSIISSLGPETDPELGQHLVVNRLMKNIHHHRPVSLGIALSYPLTDRWFLESGLTYSYLRSEYDTPNGSNIFYESYGKRIESFGSESNQVLHFIGVPLKIGYRFTLPSSFSVALSAGAMAERCVYGEWLGNKVTVEGIQLSTVASASVQYRMADRLSLFLSPEWSYYFTETELPTYHTETPAGMTLRVGLTLDLGNISLPGK